MATLKAILVEDEPLARQDLRQLLGAHPEVVVVDEIFSAKVAPARLAAPDYDLVFLDVHLRDGDGFDLVPHVRPEARIIFVTAHDEHAVRAFQVNALDYLMKPVSRARLAEALRRAIQATPPSAGLPLRVDDVVQVKTGPGAARFLPVATITLVSSQDNYSEVTLLDQSRLFVRQTMTAWEERLPATHFLRVHRHSIVNLSRVEGFAHHDDEITLLRIAGLREPVRARRRHWPELSERLAAIGRPL